jgi:hypothetical protein
MGMLSSGYDISKDASYLNTRDKSFSTLTRTRQIDVICTADEKPIWPVGWDYR